MLPRRRSLVRPLLAATLLALNALTIQGQTPGPAEDAVVKFLQRFLGGPGDAETTTINIVISHKTPAVIPPGTVQVVLTEDPDEKAARERAVARADAALAANRDHQPLQACLDNEPGYRQYQAALTDLRNIGNPGFAAPFNCSGIGASWQRPASAACCANFERDKARNVDAAWNALQSCGLRDRIEERGPAYASAVQKCLGASGLPPGTLAESVGAPVEGAVRRTADARHLVELPAFWPIYSAIRQQQAGQDAFFVRRAGHGLTVVDTRGNERPLPPVLTSRLQPGPPFAVLDDQASVSRALTDNGWTPLQVEQFWRTLQRQVEFAADSAAFEYVNWRVGAVAQYLSNTSLWTVLGVLQDLRVSSEHGSVRGTINGTGDFLAAPVGPVIRPSRHGLPAGGRIVLASRQTVAPPDRANDVILELPSGIVSADLFARVQSDLSWTQAAAVSVIEGDARVREHSTGLERRVGAGQFVLLIPGVGVTAPRPLPAARLSRLRSTAVPAPPPEAPRATASTGLVLREREPNNDAATAMPLETGASIDGALTAGTIQGRATDIDWYRLPVTSPGLYTIIVTPTLQECGYAVGLPSLRTARGPSTMTVEISGRRTDYIMRLGGLPEARSTTSGEPPRELLIAVDTVAWNSASDRGVQCVRDGAWHKEIPYRLTITAGAGEATSMSSSPGQPGHPGATYGSRDRQRRP